jgi:hypothetical protein
MDTAIGGQSVVIVGGGSYYRLVRGLPTRSCDDRFSGAVPKCLSSEPGNLLDLPHGTSRTDGKATVIE